MPFGDQSHVKMTEFRRKSQDAGDVRRRTCWVTRAMLWWVGLCCVTALGADWPTYYHDNARSGVTSETVNLPLHEQWVFISHPPKPAWTKPVKETPRVRFDEAYHVAVADDAVYFGSSADDQVYCLDVRTGEVRWTQFTGGPVRLSPTVWGGKVLVGSDDGHAYCLDAKKGDVLWKFRAAFGDPMVLGHGRMISLWPIRTGVVVDDGIAYFGAGVFPAEDIYICAVRVEDGTLLWRNDTCGEHGLEQEFGGISPQGYLLASESKLYVSSGRAMPAAFNKKDGRFLYDCSPGGKVGGTWALLTEEDLVAGLDWQVSYDKETGSRMGTDRYAWFPGIQLVVSPDSSYLLTHTEICAIDRKEYATAMKERKNAIESRSKLGERVAELRTNQEKASAEARAEIDREIQECAEKMVALDEKRKKLEDSLVKWRRPYEDGISTVLAGSTLFVGGKGNVAALDSTTGKEVWRHDVPGTASGLAVAAGCLFVSTDRGTIHCFGEAEVAAPRTVKPSVVVQPYPDDKVGSICAQAAELIVKETSVEKGYCLVLGCGTGRLAFELAKRTSLQIIGIDPDEENVRAARRNLSAASLYGTRVSVQQGSLSRLPYSDYFANLIVSETALLSGKPPGSAKEVFRVLRPCGGVAFFGQLEKDGEGGRRANVAELREWLRDGAGLEPETSHRGGAWAKVTRRPLDSAGSWTHLYADAANTAFSDDELVKCPLGVLWFGDPGPEKMVERHARAAGPLSHNGRLFVQGENVVMAYDAYNGALLWEKDIPGAVRVRVDADGSNIALTDDSVFVAVKDECLRLDAATGQTLRTYRLPPVNGGAPRRWGYLAVTEGLLYGSSAAALKEYGRLWDTVVQPDGTWGPLPADASPEMRDVYKDFVSRYPKPNERAYSDFQYSGGMWEPIATFPKWGEVRTSQGAVTSAMMTSDVVFAMDVQTGSLKWVHNGRRIAHPTISIGDGVVFFAESEIPPEQREMVLLPKRTELARLSGEEAAKLRRELESADVRLLVALDARSGEKRWEKVHDATGCGGDRMGTAYRDGILLLFGFFSNHDRALFNSGTLKWRRVTALSAAGGEILWSKEIGYLRRPVVMEDKLIVEPWMCDTKTGELETRVHPVTGKEVVWEFIRGGHSCGVTTAAPHCFFLRSYSTAYYDLIEDRGMLAFGGIRGGCWLNIIMANGLVLYPEASSGCRCSFPILSTVVLAPRQPADANGGWSLFPTKGDMTPGDGKLTPVKHLAINFGAPGDRMDTAGRLWFAYPRPSLANLQVDWVMKLALNERILPNMGYFDHNFRGVEIEGTDKPWVFASGCRGLIKCEVPLLDKGEESAAYSIRLYFAAPPDDHPGERVFHVKLQGEVVLRDFDIVRAAGATGKAVVKEFKRLPVRENLTVEFVPKSGNPTVAEAPLINGIEIVREES
ncbi:MAG: PQQ-binding-like beta-propeller repeat protein [bacterium]|nr:PQQ-binding-like beta-propeller repeat protein [bacterium]